MGGKGGSNSKVLAISVADEPDRQFVLHPGEVLSIGRSSSNDVCVDLRGVSGQHAELFLSEDVVDNSNDLPLALFLRDHSTNGTAIACSSAAGANKWKPLCDGQEQLLGSDARLRLPARCKGPERPVVVNVRTVGDALPDAWDHRRKTGRWVYGGRLGEGVLGVVYRALDRTGRHKVEVAIKVSKVPKGTKLGAKIRNAYILHREAQWSLQRLHNERWPQFNSKRAALFARYLEDQTGEWGACGADFESEREVFEASDFGWESWRPSAPPPDAPYVAMELVPGRTLHAAMGWSSAERRESPAIGREEKDALVEQAAEALEYLESCGLIHRDFRTTNLMLVGRGASCRISVIDLGHTIAAEDRNVRNRSAVVRCSWRESKTKRFDWAPPEVKVKDCSINFSMPVHAFDTFSFAVLSLQLHLGSFSAARAAVAALVAGERRDGETGALRLDEALLRRMAGDAAGRPPPFEVLAALRHKRMLVQSAVLAPPITFAATLAQMTSTASDTVRRPSCHGGFSRSRSRGRDRGHVAVKMPNCNPAWRTPELFEFVDEEDVASAVAYGSAICDVEGSDTEPD